PTKITNEAYWPGWSVVRGIALDGDGLGGYTLDAFGGLHPFGTNAGTTPPAISNPPYWPGWDIARGIALHPGLNGKGWTLDAWGGVHQWGGASHVDSPFYTPGQYISLGLVTN
ncbi:MAG TPA: hypothetical protein VEY89_01565, partial [Candidatus Dormibacteraeota bacterium]|nr:hypothetical protein [Candidatus Dormibacteraeota bacterium]